MSTQTNQKKASGSLFKNLGFLGFGLCALCCALPIVGAIAGIGVLSTIAVYFEKIGLALLIASGGLVAIGLLRQRSKSVAERACSVDCACQQGDNTGCTPLPNSNL